MEVVYYLIPILFVIIQIIMVIKLLKLQYGFNRTIFYIIILFLISAIYTIKEFFFNRIVYLDSLFGIMIGLFLIISIRTLLDVEKYNNKIESIIFLVALIPNIFFLFPNAIIWAYNLSLVINFLLLSINMLIYIKPIALKIFKRIFEDFYSKEYRVGRILLFSVNICLLLILLSIFYDMYANTIILAIGSILLYNGIKKF